MSEKEAFEVLVAIIVSSTLVGTTIALVIAFFRGRV